MIFRPFYSFDTGCAAYVFGCAGKGKCVFEKRHNPMLSLDREAFTLAAVDVPAKPAAMEELLRANRGRS